MNSVIETYLREELSPRELPGVIKFLEKGFCQDGQIAISSVFVFAREHGKRMSDVLSLMEREWQRNWYFQHPEIRGSADAPGAAGIRNRASLRNVYSALGIPSPA